VAGRAGVGAVMGSKNLKAVTARGTKKAVPHNPEKAREIFKNWAKALKGHPLTGVQLPQLGSAGLIAPMHYHNILATRNFARGQFDEFEAVSGEVLKEQHLVRKQRMHHMPYTMRKSRRSRRQTSEGPELETLDCWDRTLENSNLELILEWNHLFR